MKLFYTDIFVLPLPDGHPFPMAKYRLLRERLVAEGFEKDNQFCIPHAATDEELITAHDADYLKRIVAGDLSSQALRRLGLPWSSQLIERSRRSTGATIDACRAALMDGLSVNLAGGTHHAFKDRAEGYCVFNDSAVAALIVMAEKLVKNVVIFDCDVHQGNGTAAILADEPSVFTLSIHGRKNFPHDKEESDIDISLEDETDNDAYIKALAEGIHFALERARPELVIFLAGADPYFDDRFGRLALTKEGLGARDRLVLESCSAQKIPVAITMAGGYAKKIEDTVDIHFQTIKIAAQM